MTARPVFVTLAVAFAAVVAGSAGGADQEPAMSLLRGKTPVPETNASGVYKMERHDRAIPRSHDWQPPVIPHNVKGYQITKDVNMCMVCHGSKGAPRSGATPVSGTHYVDRENNLLPNISARRYFCLQCHVPQFDAEPLVENTFRKAN